MSHCWRRTKLLSRKAVTAAKSASRQCQSIWIFCRLFLLSPAFTPSCKLHVCKSACVMDSTQGKPCDKSVHIAIVFTHIRLPFHSPSPFLPLMRVYTLWVFFSFRCCSFLSNPPQVLRGSSCSLTPVSVEKQECFWLTFPPPIQVPETWGNLSNGGKPGTCVCVCKCVRVFI